MARLRLRSTGRLVASPIQDSEQVVQNEYDAQYDRGGDGVVTLITKSGGQQFHAQVYDSFRNFALDANTWSNKNVDPTQDQSRHGRISIGTSWAQRFRSDLALAQPVLLWRI